MAILGGSPLGLISVSSNSKNGITTFNDGASRNLSAKNYNLGTSDKYPIQDLIANNEGEITNPGINEGTRSIFSGPGVIAPYGVIVGANKTKKTSKYVGLKASSLHNDQIYDLSLLNIITQLSKTEASLRSADFAYLKDVGVFPNNRLMIARRFNSPHSDNIFGLPSSNSGALVTLISWKPQTDDFLSISFGEEWEPAAGDFTDVLNRLGNDFLGKQLGEKTGGLVAAVPLPGFTESIQRAVLQRLGVLEDNIDLSTPLPAGNPNLIKEARRRKTVGYSQAGSGLKCAVSVKFTCEWEQKFISGLDPTIVFQDILSKITNFATSRSSTYGLSEKAYNQFVTFINQPTKMIGEVITAIKSALEKVIKNITDAIAGLTSSKEKNETAEQKTFYEKSIKKLQDLGSDSGKLLDKQIQKYRIELLGIARALTGLPSTPWHVTLGNPLRPVFCAGDMYMSDDLTLTLGPTLAFNDLPSTIKAEFTLVNARNWGLQEILAKFNAGSIRVSTTIKDENDINIGDPKNALAGTTQTVNKNETGKSGASGSTAGSAVKAPTTGTANVTATNKVSASSGVVAIGPLPAGPQPTEVPTFANNFGQGPIISPTLTAGVGANVQQAKDAAGAAQAAVTGAVGAEATAAAAEASTAAASTTAKYTDGIPEVGVGANKVATDPAAIISDLSKITF